MRLPGKRAPEFLIAARTRSRASFTAASGKTTIWKEGNPGERSTSTSTSAESKPTTAQLTDFARTVPPLPSECRDCNTVGDRFTGPNHELPRKCYVLSGTLRSHASDCQGPLQEVVSESMMRRGGSFGGWRRSKP